MRIESSVVAVGSALLALALSSAGSSVARAQPLVPEEPGAALPARARAIVDAIPDEQTPPERQHYVVSNEHRFDLLVRQLEGRGGVIVGVGTDQNYTMAAIARASLVIVVDYDAVVPLVHEMYGVLVPASETPAALIARFEPASSADTEALLTHALAGRPTAAAVLNTYRANRPRFLRYLRRLERHVGEEPASWIADAAHYAYVRALFRGGRIVAHVGDLTGTHTMRAVADAARELGAPVRIFYPSNAEQFFPFGPSYVANVRALPVDARSIVVRTTRHPRLPNAVRDKWHFLVEDALDFDARLATGRYHRATAIIADLLAAGPHAVGADGGSVITTATVPPTAARAARLERPAPPRRGRRREGARDARRAP